MDFRQALSLTFEPPDTDAFRALPLAYAAGKQGGTHPCVMNAANEVAVQAFLDGRIGFVDLIPIVEAVLAAHGGAASPELAGYVEADAWARLAAEEYVNRVGNK